MKISSRCRSTGVSIAAYQRYLKLDSVNGESSKNASQSERSEDED